MREAGENMSVKKHFSSFRLSNESDKVDTVIGESVIIDGPIFSKREIKIDGIVHGSVTTKANLFLGPDSVVDGDIQGKDITICGKVKGNVFAKGRVIVTSKANISGNMSMDQLVVDEGACFNGRCSMQTSMKSVPAAPASASNTAEKPDPASINVKEK